MSTQSTQNAHRSQQAEVATRQTLFGTFLWCLPPLLLAGVLIVQALGAL